MFQHTTNHLGLDLSPLQTAQEAQNVDQYTIHELGVPGIVLMEHAGRAVANQCERFRDEGPVFILTGPGNNGGDGWVAARHLWGRGISAFVLSLVDPRDLKGDAAQAATMFLNSANALGWSIPMADQPWRVLNDAEVYSLWEQKLSPSLIVDALFGTGLKRPLAGTAAHVVQRVCDRKVPILAVDVPSGLLADGQAPVGPCVKAEATVTFGGLKIAHVSEPGTFYCGKVRTVDIGLMANTTSKAMTSRYWVPIQNVDKVAKNDPRSHKGHYGHVGVLAGASSLRGASELAAYAALRAGAGKVTLLMGGSEPAPRSPYPEVMHRPVDEALHDFQGINSLVIGPGLGQNSAEHEQAKELISKASQSGIPIVLDADGLQHIGNVPKGLHVVCTPHPKEAAQLLGWETIRIQKDRCAAAAALENLRDPGRTTFVLKGACPIVTGVDHLQYIVEGGTPALAVAGSGDVLAGLIGALLARQWTHQDAAIVGTVTHQKAGKILQDEISPRGHLASELADAIPHAMYGGEIKS